MTASLRRPSYGTRTTVALAALAFAAITMVGCSGTPDAASKPTTQRTSSAAPAPSPSATSTGGSDTADVFAERDAFFAAQGFTTGTGPLKAKTEAQKALVQAQKEWTKQKGGVWDDRTESVLLALGSDACETGILNHHRIDGSTLKSLIVSSPLTAQLIPKDAAPDKAALYERNIASMSVFSASYLCPADKQAWAAAFAAAYPG